MLSIVEISTNVKNNWLFNIITPNSKGNILLLFSL